MASRLYYGDNLDILRAQVRDDSVDLIYLDPPFNSDAAYNVLFTAPAGQRSESQVEAFQDTWHWGESAARGLEDVMRSQHTALATLLRAMQQFLGTSDLMAYLAMMAVRLIELHRVLKPTGSLYLHCDPTASHYLKLLLDAVFGGGAFRSEVIWKRTGAHGSARRWGPIHDTILFYTKSDSFCWNRAFTNYDRDYIALHYRHRDDKGIFRTVLLTRPGIRNGDSGLPWRSVDPTASGRHWAVPLAAFRRAYPDLDPSSLSAQAKLDLLDQAGLVHWPTGRGRIPNQKRYLDENPGVALQDIVLDIPPLSRQSAERLGYPTQKPLALLERIIAASSNPGDVVLDPFCGCGTAVHAAQKLGRQWIGIDVTHLAISLIERRLKDAFSDIAFEVHGTPRDLDGARDLARRDKYQFQWWAVSLVDAVPQGGPKKGADRGIDGIRWVRTGPDVGDVERVLVSVKGGDNVSVAQLRDLAGTIERERAKGGLFVTLAEPTREMRREAAAAGFFDTGFGTHPRIQIMTIRELLAGMRPDLPPLGRNEGFRRAPRERGPRPRQSGLDL